ncbi:alpha/beta hydrolase [Glaciecola sp. 1036]|uniref:alpha/beta hydrolase n=1 Tax=Alteromonadaceae TaxID=72275 RepID=UPI003D0358C3
MKQIVILFFLALSFTYFSAKAATPEQIKIAKTEYPTQILYKLWQDHQNDPNAALRFYNTLDQKHLIEVSSDAPNTATVTYFAKGSEDTDYIMQSGGPDFYGLRFKQIGNTDIYFCVQKIPTDAFFTYGVNEFKRKKVEGTEQLYQTDMAHIYDGTVIGPQAPLSNYIVNHKNVAKGIIKEVIIESEYMDEKRKLEVYLPANYNPAHAHNLVIQLDGQNFSADAEQAPAWRGWTPLPTILDNLINEDKITPTIAVFVHNQGNRSKDLIDDRMADFIALEVLPWAKSNFNVSSDNKHIVLSGPSRAGFTAAYTALRHSELIGSVLSQSGSFYYTKSDKSNWPIYPEFEGVLIPGYKDAPTQNIQFYLDVGLYDLGLAAVGTNRRLKDILQLKGYKVEYYEYKGGHSHLAWRHTLAKGLITLIGNK